jgi:hypothetical protein
VNFSPDGRLLAVSEEDNRAPDAEGSPPALLNHPDDAHLLEDGTFITADICNCRVPRHLGYPDRVTPVDGGDILVAEIRGAWISRITRDHPSLARADDLRERVVVIHRATRAVIWQYGATDRKGHAPGCLNYPDGFDIDVSRDWKGALGA